MELAWLLSCEHLEQGIPLSCPGPPDSFRRGASKYVAEHGQGHQEVLSMQVIVVGGSGGVISQ